MTWKELQQAASQAGARPSDTLEFRNAKGDLVHDGNVITKASRTGNNLTISFQPKPLAPVKGPALGELKVTGQATVTNPPSKK